MCVCMYIWYMMQNYASISRYLACNKYLSIPLQHLQQSSSSSAWALRGAGKEQCCLFWTCCWSFSSSYPISFSSNYPMISMILSWFLRVPGPCVLDCSCSLFGLLHLWCWGQMPRQSTLGKTRRFWCLMHWQHSKTQSTPDSPN